MTILDKLARRFGRYAIPHLTLYIISLQVVIYLLGAISGDMRIFYNAALVPALVLKGEIYRIFSFLFMPPSSVSSLGAVWAFFYWYLLFLFGSAMEEQWGTFRYNVYLFIGYLATLVAVFLNPFSSAMVPNDFLYLSVFLAFAHLYPDFELRIMFLFPIAVKWLALLAWLGFGFKLATAVFFGEWVVALTIVAAVLNYFIFFGREIAASLRQKQRQAVQVAGDLVDVPEAFHICQACGVTDLTHPETEFRYDNGSCYCMDHLAEENRP
jgi:hypothetical protein